MRVLTDRLRSLDIWSPRDVAEFLGINYKTALELTKSFQHIHTGGKYFVARSVVMSELGLNEKTPSATGDDGGGRQESLPDDAEDPGISRVSHDDNERSTSRAWTTIQPGASPSVAASTPQP